MMRMLALSQIAGLLAHLRDQVLADDRSRNRPGRVEIDLGNFRLQQRRLAIDLADAGGVAGRDGAVLDGFHHSGRDVGNDIAVAEIARPGAQPDNIGLQLADTAVDRHVQRGHGGAVDGARGREAHASLEVAHARFNIGVVDVAVAGIGIEIAGDDQALAQRDHAGAARTDAELVADLHHRPAAPGREITIGDDRRFSRLKRFRREHRGVGAGHGVARAGIIALAPLRLLGESRQAGGRRSARKQRENGLAAGQAQIRHHIPLLHHGPTGQRSTRHTTKPPRDPERLPCKGPLPRLTPCDERGDFRACRRRAPCMGAGRHNGA
jgi:hypothetical protein